MKVRITVDDYIVLWNVKSAYAETRMYIYPYVLLLLYSGLILEINIFNNPILKIGIKILCHAVHLYCNYIYS